MSHRAQYHLKKSYSRSDKMIGALIDGWYALKLAALDARSAGRVTIARRRAQESRDFLAVFAQKVQS
jgi:hypothetical protein